MVGRRRLLVVDEVLERRRPHAASPLLVTTLASYNHSRYRGNDSPRTGTARSISMSTEEMEDCGRLFSKTSFECVAVSYSDSSLSEWSQVSVVRGRCSGMSPSEDEESLLRDSAGSSEISCKAICVPCCLSKRSTGSPLLSTVVDNLLPLTCLPPEA